MNVTYRKWKQKIIHAGKYSSILKSLNNISYSGFCISWEKFQNSLKAGECNAILRRNNLLIKRSTSRPNNRDLYTKQTVHLLLSFFPRGSLVWMNSMILEIRGNVTKIEFAHDYRLPTKTPTDSNPPTYPPTYLPTHTLSSRWNQII